MTEFVRPVHEHIKDMFILDIEAFCDFADNLKYHIPDSLSESKFHATLGSIHKESSNGFVVGEALGSGEDVVLHGRDGSHCNLRGEVPHLVLAQSESSLTLLKDDFQRPAPGVDSVGFEEVELPVCGNESVPLPSFVALGEEQTYVAACKGHVGGDVVASQTAAILATLLRMVEEGDELVGGVLLTFICILRPAHLDHTKIMAPDVSGSDEQNDFCTSKPTVGQHIVETDLTLDNAAYHLNHQGNLALVVFPNPFGGMGAFRMCIWKAWKKPKTKVENLVKCGVEKHQAYMWGNTRLGHWRISRSPILLSTISNANLKKQGYPCLLDSYLEWHPN